MILAFYYLIRFFAFLLWGSTAGIGLFFAFAGIAVPWWALLGLALALLAACAIYAISEYTLYRYLRQKFRASERPKVIRIYERS